MRIVVNDTAASYGGAMTVLKSFYDYVKEHDWENEYIFLLSDAYLEETDNIKVRLLPSVKKSSLHKLWFDFVVGRKLLNELQPDRVISLQNIITFGYRGEQWVYVHQSIPFQTEKDFSFFKNEERSLAVYQYLIGAVIKKSIRYADRVFVQTGWMKKNVIQKCRIPDDKIGIIRISTERPLNYCSYSCRGNRFFSRQPWSLYIRITGLSMRQLIF